MRRLVGILLSFVLVSCGSEGGRLSWLSSVETEALIDPGVAGPFKVASYIPTSSSSGYKSAIIYYPSDSLDATLPATTLTGGFSNNKEDMTWLGSHLASQGFIAIIFTPTNSYSLDAKVWANGHRGSIDTLKAENALEESPISGRIDVDRLGLMGYSYGGAGAILAANQLGSVVRSVVPLCAFNPTTPTAQIPFMFITGTNDTVAQPNRILTAFNNYQNLQPKSFVKLNKLDHNDISNGGSLHESIGRFATAWSQVFLAKKTAYDTWLIGEEAQKQIQNTQVFAKAADYIYQD